MKEIILPVRAILTAGAIFAAAQCRADAFATATGVFEEKNVGADVVRIFTNDQATATLTVSRPVYADILVVGGGGSGGGNMGAGGGGGGVVLTNGVLLAPGTYEITVGAGGAKANWQAGNNGGVSSIILVNGDERTSVVTALGGGGGGNYNTIGGTGATGGGNRGYGTRGLGYGGAGYPHQADAAGGGSVLEIGQEATGGYAGAGGKGFYCDISGENDFYGWGGGGSSKSTAGCGGAGDPLGFGHGGGNGTAPDGCTGGRPGHGGGGGGMRNANTLQGGSGTVIIRYARLADAAEGAPIVRTAAQSRIGSTSLQLAGALDELGDAASVTVRLLYGTAANALNNAVDLGVKTATGEFVGTITDLEKYTDYYYCFEAVGTATTLSDVRRVKTIGMPDWTYTGLAAVTTNGAYEIVAFTNGAATVTFTKAGTVDLLVVGGGGSGANRDSSSHAGGGGGGGGVLMKSDLAVETGKSYSITVGAGGEVPAQKWGLAGLKGGDSFIALDGADILRAYGGGGGNDYTALGGVASLGASGGGVSGNANAKTSIAGYVCMQGCAGAGAYAAGTGTEYNGGGGGGAGGDGEPDDEYKGGNGGIGVSSEIFGDIRWFGAGGGGAGMAKGSSPGGDGLGGSSVGGDANKPGVANTGSGGGGCNLNLGAEPARGRGADGIVVLRRRIADADDATPLGEAEQGETGAAFATFTVTVRDPGGNGLHETADVLLSVVPEGEEASFETVAEGLKAKDVVSFIKSGLSPKTAYAWSVKLQNAATSAIVGSGTFTTVSKPAGAGVKPLLADVTFVSEDAYSTTISWSVPWAGDNAGTVDVVLTWGTADEPTAHVDALAEAVAGTGRFVLTGLEPATAYVFSLQATNDKGVSGDAVDGALTTRGGYVRVNGYVSAADESSATIAWTVRSRGDAASSVSAALEWGTDATFATHASEPLTEAQLTLPPFGGTFTASGLALNVTYYFRVRAVNDLGLVSVSPAFSYTPKAFRTEEAGGEVTYCPATVADMAKFHGTDLVLCAGDKIALPLVGDGGYYTSVASDVATVEGGVLTAKVPGGIYVTSATVIRDSLAGAAVTNTVSKNFIVVVPRPAEAPAGVWISRRGHFDWTNGTCWVQISGPDGAEYPNGIGVWAGVFTLGESVSGTVTNTITLPSEGVTVGTFAQAVSLDAYPYHPQQLSGGPLTFEQTGDALAFWKVGGGPYASQRYGSVNLYPNNAAESTPLVWKSSGGIDFGNCAVAPYVAVGASVSLPAAADTTFSIVRGTASAALGRIDLAGDVTGSCAIVQDARVATYPLGGASTRDKSFAGTLDVRRGEIHFENGSFKNAKKLALRGAYEASGEGGVATMFVNGNAYDTTQNWNDQLPRDLELDGGYAQLAPNGAKTTGKPDEMHFGTVSFDAATMGTFGIYRTPGVSKYGLAMTVTNIAREAGACVRYRWAGNWKTDTAALSNAVTIVNTPEGAVDCGDGRELLPFLFTRSYLVNALNYQENFASDYSVLRDKATGRLSVEAADVTCSLKIDATTARGRVVGGRNVNGVSDTTVDDAEILALADNRVGNFLYTFAKEGATLKIVTGQMFLDKSYSFARPEHANSASSTLDFGDVPGYIYQPYHAAHAGYYRPDIWRTEYEPVGCKIKSSKGLVKALDGYLALCGDSSATLKGALNVVGGRLRLGFVTNDVNGVETLYAGKVGTETIRVAAGGRLEIACEQPFPRKAAIVLRDRSAYGAVGVVSLEAGEATCRTLHVEGVQMHRGTWGSSLSGAEHVDDVHFAGTGRLRVTRDAFGPGFSVLVR